MDDCPQPGYDAALAAYEWAKSDRIAAEQKLSDEIARQEAEEVAKQQAAKQQAAYTPKHLAGTDTAQPGSLAQTGDRAGLIGETFVIGGTVLVAAGVFLDRKKRRERDVGRNRITTRKGEIPQKGFPFCFASLGSLRQ